MTFEIIKSNFDKGLWTAQMVAVAVTKNIITLEQFREITGQAYSDIIK